MKTHQSIGLVQHTRVLMVACFAVCFMSATTHAQLFYDFVEDRTGHVMATLELSSLPATPAEAVSLTFTPEAMSFFGLSMSTYLEFDQTINNFPIIESPPMHLGCGDTPPCNIHWNVSSMFYLSMLFSDSIDQIFDFGGPALSNGDWIRAVPEPGSGLLCFTAVIIGAGMGRRRKRRAPLDSPVLG